jgi:hypothetical protein
MSQIEKPAVPSSATPWYRVPFVWMVIAGPAIVVVAGFTTLGIAITHPDPLVTAPTATRSADLPAVQGRNHAATPTR